MNRQEAEEPGLGFVVLWVDKLQFVVALKGFTSELGLLLDSALHNVSFLSSGRVSNDKECNRLMSVAYRTHSLSFRR
jgi:hypothetical protein